jgi:hypothetical protein
MKIPAASFPHTTITYRCGGADSPGRAVDRLRWWEELRAEIAALSRCMEAVERTLAAALPALPDARGAPR